MNGTKKTDYQTKHLNSKSLDKTKKKTEKGKK